MLGKKGEGFDSLFIYALVGVFVFRCMLEESQIFPGTSICSGIGKRNALEVLKLIEENPVFVWGHETKFKSLLELTRDLAQVISDLLKFRLPAVDGDVVEAKKQSRKLVEAKEKDWEIQMLSMKHSIEKLALRSGKGVMQWNRWNYSVPGHMNIPVWR
ncbi:hypothetical protein GUITHDRAFT_121655 [Guillardia theta CCMP2712]|nr:hypothetical protein GUITHDRAFT_121655 [Guillardia theta CCMP2712]EKX32161.1 hypothetical protein GUITHDRAFT_121655 [Guillardia theta CCMP2712]|eukprot:XP_005819141.1 hypothetical protein GUITHDRAFT_121655 [Guillardia theta CCMP2712]